MNKVIQQLKADKLKLVETTKNAMARKRERAEQLEDELRDTRAKLDRPVVNKTVHYHGDVDNSVKVLNIGKKSIDWLRNDKFLETAYRTWEAVGNPLLAITNQLESSPDCEQKRDLLNLKAKDPKQYQKTILNTIAEEVEKSDLADKVQIIKDVKEIEANMYEVD